MVFLLNGKSVDALALVVHRSNEHEIGKAWVKKLREYRSPMRVSAGF